MNAEGIRRSGKEVQLSDRDRPLPNPATPAALWLQKGAHCRFCPWRSKTWQYVGVPCLTSATRLCSFRTHHLGNYLLLGLSGTTPRLARFHQLRAKRSTWSWPQNTLINLSVTGLHWLERATTNLRRRCCRYSMWECSFLARILMQFKMATALAARVLP